MARGKAAYRRSKENRFSMILVTLVVLLIMAVVAIGGIEVKHKIEGYDIKAAQLEAEIAAEEQRKEEISQYKIYTQTKAYYEEVAKDKLGLVYEGEIMFKQE